VAKHQLADCFRSERSELIRLGRELSDAQGALITTACPAWSIKDVYAHLAGISTDILAGNTEGAATEPWADGHVADRIGRSLTEVLNEWESAGNGVSEVMDTAGEVFPFQLFVDQWTHGWDVRATLGADAAAVPDLSTYIYFLPDFFDHMAALVPEGLTALTLKVAGQSFDIGTGEPIGELGLDLFEFARVTMGRRSQQQLDGLPWPRSLDDNAPYIDVLVAWSVNDQDVIDPVLS